MRLVNVDAYRPMNDPNDRVYDDASIALARRRGLQAAFGLLGVIKRPGDRFYGKASTTGVGASRGATGYSVAEAMASKDAARSCLR